VPVAGGNYPGISGKRETSPDRDKERQFQFNSMVPDNLLIFHENMMWAIRETSSASHFQAFAMSWKGSSTRKQNILYFLPEGQRLV
jgi:hypothetical protein